MATGRSPCVAAVYTALVGWFDWVTGSNYMFLAAVPRNGALLSVLGPWPWYILSAAGVAIVLVRKWVVSGQAKHPGGALRSRDGLWW